MKCTFRFLYDVSLGKFIKFAIFFFFYQKGIAFPYSTVALVIDGQPSIVQNRCHSLLMTITHVKGRDEENCDVKKKKNRRFRRVETNNSYFKLGS